MTRTLNVNIIKETTKGVLVSLVNAIHPREVLVPKAHLVEYGDGKIVLNNKDTYNFILRG